MAVVQPWAEVAEPIHRRVAQLVDAESGQEVLWVGCGSGRSVLWWTGRFQTHVVGVDPDHDAIESAERAARDVGLSSLATFQTAEPADLPHESEVFDVTIVNMLYLPGADGESVMREAGRVARPMSTIAALVPSWLSTPDPEDVRLLESIGIRARLLMEWKSFFRLGGIVELSVEDAAQDGGWLGRGRLRLLVRGWRAAGWAGVRMVLGREFKVLRALAERRVLGLSLVKGTRWPHA
jgi:SAM-dependent methyltransferase